MKEVINGKMYNTETAEAIHEWDNGLYGNDFRSCEKTLYRTKKGNYFVAGEGGPMSCYAVSNGNTTSGGSGIRPIEKEDVVQWLEEHDGTEAIEQYFANEIEEA